MATGHYARIFNSIELKVKSQKLRVKHIAIPDPGGSLGSKAGIQELSHRFPNTSLKNTVGSENDKDNMILYLYKGIDSTKDQSYFLYQLTQEQLSKIIFPLGEMTKTEVRKIAQENQLPVYEKIESQEICFIPDSDYREFLKRYLPADYFKPGRIVDKDGWTIGSHDGLVNFTIGQRRGISQNTKSKTQDTKALYVLGFNAGKNELIVGKDDELNQDQFTIENAHFIDPIVEERSEENEISNISVKIRYRSVEIPCTIKPIIHTSKFLICLKQPARAIAPGQSAVFYLGDKVIGGGIIASKTDYL